MNDNPWKLSHGEMQALDQWVLQGTQTGAAKALGVNRTSVATAVMRARVKMQAKHAMQAVLMWDRFAYGREGAA